MFIFQLGEYIMFNKRDTSISKRNATLLYMAMCSFFTVVIFYSFKINLFSIVFVISVFFTFLGMFLFMFYNDELNERYHFKTEFSYTYQSEALCYLALSTSAIGVFLFLFILFDMGLYKAVLYTIIYLLPFLGVGLRFNAFNDESRWIRDKQVIGYRPFYYLLCAMYVVLLGYYPIFHTPSITNSIILFITTTFSYLGIIFPDKVNKYLPFDNRELIGFIIYLGFIMILSSMLIDHFATVTLMESLGG